MKRIARAALILVLYFFLPHFAAAQTPGVVSDTIRCQKSPDQTYALYLPASFSPSKTFGIILFYEPVARGKIPVTLYKQLADKYNLILACSNNSRNGPVEPSLYAGNAVFEDVLARFPVNKQLIITSGFSGGGRMAVQMAIINKEIDGVITCGAAFPAPNSITRERSIPIAEVIGRFDMNFQEALSANQYLRELNNPRSLTFFYGLHDWPTVDSYEEAVAWHYLRLNKMDKTLMDGITSRQLQRAVAQLDSGNVFEANGAMLQLKENYPGTISARKVDSIMSDPTIVKKIKTGLKNAQKLNDRANRMQTDFFVNYQQHMLHPASDSAFHPQYWAGFRRDCDKLRSSDDRYKADTGVRLIEFAWHMCSEQHQIFMEYGQFSHAAMAARIWTLVLPDRVRPCVQAAKAFALQNKKRDAMYYLQLAVDRGLKDKAAVRNDPAFSAISSSEDFKKLLQDK
jgi:hypothetical protein